MRSTHAIRVHEVEYGSLGGVRVAGWYCTPREEHAEPPYPALIISPGYMSEPEIPKAWARQGYASLAIAPRGKLRSNRHFNPGYPGLLVHNLIDRHTYSYRGIYADALRAIDFLATRPEIDMTRVGVVGHSQGATLSIVIAALRPGSIRCAALGAPFLAGIQQAVSLTHSYPYEEINEYLREHPGHLREFRETAAYFDCINLAPMIRCPVLMNIGLADDVCPPETGIAVYEAMDCEKQLLATDGANHNTETDSVRAQTNAFLAENLRPRGTPASGGGS